MACVSCDASPPPCSCPTFQTCVQTPRNCTSCPINLCIDSNSRSLPSGPGSSSSNNPALAGRGGGGAGLGATVGEAVGGVVGGLGCVVVAWWLWKKGVLDRLFSKTAGGRKGRQAARRRHTQLQDQLQLSFRLPSAKNADQTTGEDAPQGTSTGVVGSGERTTKRQSAHLVDVDLLDDVDFLDPPRPNRINADGAHTPSLSFSVPRTDKLAADPFGDHHSLKSTAAAAATPTPSTPAGAIGLSNLSRPLSTISERSLLSAPRSSLRVTGDFDAIIANLTASEGEGKAKIPIAYIPPDSKSLSIDDVAARDGFGNPIPSSSRAGTQPLASSRISSQSQNGALPSLPSDILLPTLPPPTALLANPNGSGSGSSSHVSGSGAPLSSPGLAVSANGKPIRPPRPSDLDLKLPKAEVSTTPLATTPTAPGPGQGRPPSGFPWTAAGPSPSAVAVGAEGKESRFSSSTVNTLQLARASDASTATALAYMSSPGTQHSLSTQEHLALSTIHESDRASLLSTATTDDEDAASSQGHLSSILDPAMIVTPVTVIRTASGKHKAVQRVLVKGQERAKVLKIKGSNSAGKGKAKEGEGEGDPFGDEKAVMNQSSAGGPDRLSLIGQGEEHLDDREEEERPDSRASNTDSIFSDASLLHGGGLQTAERVVVQPAAGAGRSPLSRQVDGKGKGPLSPLFPSPPTSRRKSTSPARVGAVLVGDENRRPSLADQTTDAGRLPEPFKPFAGQKPTSMTGSPFQSLGQGQRVHSVAESMGGGGNDRASLASSAGGDSVSIAGSVRSGYGSVLEGIPFNIGIGVGGGLGFGLGSERGSVLSEGEETTIREGREVSMISAAAGSEVEEERGSLRFSDVLPAIRFSTSEP